MDAAVADVPQWFSTESLPEQDRLAVWREEFGRTIVGVDWSPVGGRPLQWSARFHSFHDLGLTYGQTTGIIARRTRALLADGNDDLIFTTNLSGFSVMSQLGRERRLDPGTAVLVSSADVGTHDIPGPTSCLVLRVPRRALLASAGKAEDALMLPIPADAEPVRLLVDYVAMGLRQHWLASPSLGRLFATHVHDLVALAIGAGRDAAEAARGRGLVAARLSAAKGEIMRRLENAALTIGDVARRLGVTPRYVQMLFEAEGTTFSEYVLAQRLARTHRMLSDPRFLHRTVTAIASDVGFGHLSYFNRVFRRAYGTTPSEVRASARAEIALVS
jgi:AraC-like DNA-binding protein